MYPIHLLTTRHYAFDEGLNATLNYNSEPLHTHDDLSISLLKTKYTYIRNRVQSNTVGTLTNTPMKFVRQGTHFKYTTNKMHVTRYMIASSSVKSSFSCYEVW